MRHVKRRGGPRILDGRRFLGVLRRVVRRYRTQARAADALHITPGRLSQLLATRPADLKSLSRSLYEQLALMVGERERDELVASVLTAEGRERLSVYRRWCARHVAAMSTAPYVVELVQVKVVVRQDPAACAVVVAFLRDLERRGWDVEPELSAWARRPGTLSYRAAGTDPRVRVAVGRLLAPLVESSAAGPVERSVEELLGAGQLAAFLSAGARRELILLRRAPDVDRARAGGPALGPRSR